MNVSDLIQGKYGVLTRARTNPLIEELTTAVRMILPNNPNRLSWVICNLSVTNCFIAWDRGVGADHGIILAANGGTATMCMEEDFEATCWEVFGISLGVNQDLFTLSVEIAGPLPGKE